MTAEKEGVSDGVGGEKRGTRAMSPRPITAASATILKGTPGQEVIKRMEGGGVVENEPTQSQQETRLLNSELEHPLAGAVSGAEQVERQVKDGVDAPQKQAV